LGGLADTSGMPLVSWSIVEESLSEAEFLWTRREAALAAPDETPDGVEERIEERLLGAIEGLCVPGADAVDRVLAPALDSDEPEIVAAAAHALLAGGTGEGADCFGDAFLRSSGARLEAMRHGLELIAVPGPYLGLVAKSRRASDQVRAAFLNACAFRGLPLETGVGELVTSVSPPLQRAAARLLRHAPRAIVDVWLPRALRCVDLEARAVAAETGLIVGSGEAWACCRELAVGAVAVAGRVPLLLALAMSGSPHDHDLVLRLLGSPARQREAIWALGFGGRRSGADACIDLLAREHHPPLAAEAFCAITGLDLARAELVVPGLAEPDDALPSAEDRLPHPDIAGVIRWWNRNRSRFEIGTRYLAGRSVSVPVLVEALAQGPMRRRPPVALELAVRTQGRAQIETRTFVGEQRQRWASLVSGPDNRPSSDRAGEGEGEGEGGGDGDGASAYVSTQLRRAPGDKPVCFR
jgi:uncharacterized protein (TIGR02270 family)